jgi:hypothetical protein
MLSVDFMDYHQLQTFWAQKTSKHPSFPCPAPAPQNTLHTQNNLIIENSCTRVLHRKKNEIKPMWEIKIPYLQNQRVQIFDQGP